MENRRIKALFRKSISMLLAVMMLFNMTEGAFAYMFDNVRTAQAAAEAGEKISVTDQSGVTTDVSNSSEWETTYPYGAFAFEKANLTVDEGGDTVIKVYRLGGTTGRATAYITYEPLVYQNTDGTREYANALSSDDVEVDVEEPQPAAQYEAVGKKPDPEEGGTATVKYEKGSDGYTLSLSETADTYQWQILSGSLWMNITDATKATVPMDAGYVEGGQYDFRCVYTTGGTAYCSSSMNGTAYVKPAAETPEAMPEGTALNAEPVYTPLALDSEEYGKYSGNIFQLIFADGEWVKEIHIKTTDDAEAEAIEGSAFTIRYYDGGDIFANANTMLLRVQDNDKALPSTIGFETSAIAADKASGKVKLTVKRVGGNTTPVTVAYATEDGTAKAGTDYASASGTMMFYAGVDTQSVTVDLIDDGKASEDKLDFSFTLSDLKGDDDCTFEGGGDTLSAAVSLYNSGTGDGSNLATQLHDASAVDLTGGLEESPTAANSGSEPVVGVPNETGTVDDSVRAQLVPTDKLDGELSAQLHQYKDASGVLKALSFTNYAGGSYWPGSYNANFYSDWRCTYEWSDDGSSDQQVYDYTMSNNVTGTLGSGAKETITSGFAVTSKNEVTYNLSYFPGADTAGQISQMFSGFSANGKVDCASDTTYLSGSTYYHSYLFPRLEVFQAGGGSTDTDSRPVIVKAEGGNWAGSTATKVYATNDWVNYSNPLDFSFSRSLDISKSASFNIKMSNYNNTNERTDDDMNNYTMLWLKNMTFTRRTFGANAFFMEISTPNDANNTPLGCSALSDDSVLYSKYLEPAVTIDTVQKDGLNIVMGGATSSNALYVGSTLTLRANAQAANLGYALADNGLVIYQSKDGGKSWSEFNKFLKSYSNGAYTVKLVGGDSDHLDSSDLSALYKFRLLYVRSSTVTLNITPSVPRASGSASAAIDTTKTGGAWTQLYNSISNHKITLHYSAYTSGGDYTNKNSSGTVVDNTITQSQGVPATSPLTVKDGAATWSFDVKNLQYLNFNLPAEDLIVYNGRSYAGNENIYLSAKDYVGGSMVFYYYDSEYQNAISAMTTTIMSAGLYWDKNGNGKIDGTFDKDGIFSLTENADEFVELLPDGDYDETLFQPLDGKPYILRYTYSMLPRCLILPAGAKDTDRAQLMPAFVTALDANTPAYASLTSEQKAYRYIRSGKLADDTYTSDNHVMYGAAATVTSVVDVPLGGDKSPTKLNADGNAYVWSPNFADSADNLLFYYTSPEPITVTNSAAGATKIAACTETKNILGTITGYQYDADGLAKMNGYLASFTGSSTCALVSQIQTATTGKFEEKSANTDQVIKPDAVTVSGIRTFPDAGYLNTIGTASGSSVNPNAAQDMGDSGNEMPEFNSDLGINFGSNEVSVTDYATFVCDGDKVGFAVGLPLGEVGATKEDAKGFKNENKEKWTQFGDFFNNMKDSDESYKNAKNAKTAGKDQKDSGFKSKDFSVEFSVGLAFMWVYNPLDNGYYFEGMTVSATAELTFRLQMRLAVCPVFYVYMEVGASLELGTGLGVIRDSVDGTPVIDERLNAAKATSLTYTKGSVDTTGYFISDSDYKKLQTQNPSESEKYPNAYVVDKVTYHCAAAYKTFDAARQACAKNLGMEYTFITDAKAFNIRFTGKITVNVYTMQNGEYAEAPKTDGYVTGYISSDGTEDTQVVLKKQDGLTLGSKVMVVLRPMENADTGNVSTISYIAPITGIRNEVYWKGVSIAPSVSIEGGMGVGMELLKAELYLKLSLEASFTLGKFNEGYLKNADVDKYEGGTVDSFEFYIGIGLRVVLVFFTFELDAVGWSASYDGDADKWETGWKFLNDLVGQSADGSGSVTVGLPDNSTEQQLYTPEDNADALSAQAYDPTDSNVPFQYSGYGSSVNAAQLTTGDLSGSSYKVVTTGGRDFVVYVRKLTGTAAEDASQLVMSELKTKKVSTEGNEYTYGLVNPADSSNTTTPYIVLDTSRDNSDNVVTDNAGDLDFDVRTSESGGTYTVQAAWVSYASPTAAPKESDYYTVSGTPIDATAYAALTSGTEAYYAIVDDTTTTYQLCSAYGTYKTAQAARDAFTGDTNSFKTDAQWRAARTAKNKTVRTASWSFTRVTSEGVDTDTNAASFSAAAALPAANAGYFLPSVGDGGAVFYGSVAAFDNGTAYSDYDSYLTAVNINSKGEEYGYNNYLRTMKKSTLDVYGTQSALNLAYFDGSAWKTASQSLNPGQTLSNVEFTKLDDDAYYVAYTTKEYSYVGKGTEADPYTDLVTQDSLYLRKVTVTGDSGSKTVEWGSPYLIRQTCDYDHNTGKDGVYTTGGLSKAYDSPYISSLSFLTGKIDPDTLTGSAENFSAQAVETHTFLLFEMDGTTYIILDSSLKSITGMPDTASGKTSGTIYPFFTGATRTNSGANKTAATSTDTASGKMQVTIGANAAGDIYAVYAGSVPDTTNNALYISYYNPDTYTDGTATKAIGWSDGVMLVMNHMNTYEAAIREGWDDVTTQAAYLGLSTTNGLIGSKADIKTLFGASSPDAVSTDAYAALQAAKKTDLGDKKNFTFTGIQAVTGVDGELLILTQGLTQTLKLYGTTDKTVAPDKDTAAVNGLYAISYGKAKAQLSEGSISFAGVENFAAGSKLYVDISALNAGDTAIRASESQAATATLNVGTVASDGTITLGQELKSWSIKSNVRSGQKLSLSGACTALTSALGNSSFILTVTENKAYVGEKNAQTFRLVLKTLTPRADLAVENFAAVPVRVEDNGAKTVLKVSFTAANRGTAAATGVYAKFSYATGEKDKYGNSVYADLTPDSSKFTIGQETALSSQSLTKAGVLDLYGLNSDGTTSSDNLGIAKGRTVTGEITVPCNYFASGDAKALDIKVELAEGYAQLSASGTDSSAPNEYYTANNSASALVQATDVFEAPDSVVLPVGTTTLVPVTIYSSRGTRPDYAAVEIKNDADGENLGILNFKQTSASGGKVSGVLSITPTAKGSGVLHLYDTATSEFVAVAFEITDAGTGIDIYNDNDAFAFKNANGSAYSAAAAADTQNWRFYGLTSWGSTDTNSLEVPLRANISHGTKGASFTFSTVAESIKLYFQGTVTVSSSRPNFASASYTNTTGGSIPTDIQLGTNANNDSYTVTVTVTSDSANFDRLQETYGTGGAPTPTLDKTSPSFFWSRSFPGTGVIGTDTTTVPVTLYVLDNSGLSYLTVDGTRYDTGSTEITQTDGEGGRLWAYTFQISANGSHNISAWDTSGNVASTTLLVDWFLKPANEDTNKTIEVPQYTAGFCLDAAALDPAAQVGISDVGKLNITFKEASANTKKSDNTFSVSKLNDAGTGFEAVSGDSAKFPISGNGIYYTQTVNEDNTWSASLLSMDRVDSNAPSVSLKFDADALTLSWSASKKSSNTASAITSVTINGYKVNTSTGIKLSGTLPITCGGIYTITVTDQAGNKVSQDNPVSLPIDISKCTLTVQNAWNQAGTNGAVAFSGTSAITGGNYTNDVAKALNPSAYSASYEAALVSFSFDEAAAEKQLKADYAANHDGAEMPAADLTAGLAALRDGAHTAAAAKAAFADVESTTYDNLNVGVWLLIVRDKNDPENVHYEELAVGSSALKLANTTMDASGSGKTDGRILSTVEPGNAQGYEFAVLPAASSSETADIAKFQGTSVVWHPGTGDTLTAYLSSGLTSGYYLVAARGVYSVDQTKLSGLVAAQQALLSAQSALSSANTAATADSQAKELEARKTVAKGYYSTYAMLKSSLAAAESVDAARKTLTDYVGTAAAAALTVYEAAISGGDPDYETKLAAYQDAVEAYLSAQIAAETAAAVKTAESDVTAKTTACTAAADAVTAASAAQYTTGSEYWSGADVALVYVGYRKSSSVSAINTLTTDANGTTVFELSGADATLSDADIAEIYQADQTNNVMLRAGGLSVYIPKKLLTASFDVNRLLTGLTGAADGSIVEYTDLNGKKSVDPWCLVSNGKAQYLVIGLGDYKLVPKSASFSDIDGLWGKDNILFTAVRDLFNGTSGDSFSPNVTMSRAMFVTVLWRLDGSPAVTGESGFTDLTQDWYRTAVLWASQNGIVKGYSGTLFGPDDPVSREQMCVFLTRYLAYRSMKLTVKQKATDFSDAAKISSWAKDSVDECTSSGLILGTGANRFTPARDASRMEVSTLFERFIDALVSKYAGA